MTQAEKNEKMLEILKELCYIAEWKNLEKALPKKLLEMIGYKDSSYEDIGISLMYDGGKLVFQFEKYVFCDQSDYSRLDVDTVLGIMDDFRKSKEESNKERK
jgi:hypothetical protein